MTVYTTTLPCPRVLVAAPMSGSGKTTVTAGLIGAFRARGLHVAPFKCGPDYIDPSYHRLAAGRPCPALDAWMLPEGEIAALLAERGADADLALIEGVMGLFDGYAGDGDTGSSAHIARLTATPVVVVLDVRAMARTAAALIQGLRDFDPRVRVAGVILNRAGSQRHAAMVRDAIDGTTGLPVLGCLVRDDAISLPERHLGLIPTAEPGRWRAWLADVAARVADCIDLDAVLALARSASPLAAPPPPRGVTAPDTSPVVAVAADEAFSFRYEELLDALHAAGATICTFSPLRDTALPEGTAALYLCGGFPELYAAELSANTTLQEAIRAAAARRLPIYAECGGLMYLTEALVDAAGAIHAMAGVLPGRSVMGTRVTLGYRTVRAAADNWLWRTGETMRGHEFHYSRWENRPPQLERLYDCLPDALRSEERPEGARHGSVVASYVHLHPRACPQLVSRLVAAARTFQNVQVV